MSWDVMIFNFDGPRPAVVDDWKHGDNKPLGPAREVRDHIARTLFHTDWSDPVWGVHEGHGFSIEFNIHHNDPPEYIMLHIRGGGGDIIAAIRRFAEPAAWVAMDVSSGDWIDLSQSTCPGWKGWKGFRERLVDQYVQDEDEPQ